MKNKYEINDSVIVVDDFVSGGKLSVIEIPVEGLSEEDRQSILSNESKFVGINHPNIIGYSDCYISEDYLYLESNYYEGMPISEYLFRNNAFGLEESFIVGCFMQICLALKYLHDRNCVHRGLSCLNILLMPNGLVKLICYSKMRILDRIKYVSAKKIRYPGFLPPEVCLGKPYGKKGDIWALGCILFEMCCLKFPFESEDSLIRSILNNHVSFPNHKFSIETVSLIETLLNKSDVSRPSINSILSKPCILNQLGSESINNTTRLIRRSSIRPYLIEKHKENSNPNNRPPRTAPGLRKGADQTKKIMFMNRKKRFQQLSLGTKPVSILKPDKKQMAPNINIMKEEIRLRRVELTEQILRKQQNEFFADQVSRFSNPEYLQDLVDSFNDSSDDENEIMSLVSIANSILNNPLLESEENCS